MSAVRLSSRRPENEKTANAIAPSSFKPHLGLCCRLIATWCYKSVFKEFQDVSNPKGIWWFVWGRKIEFVFEEYIFCPECYCECGFSVFWWRGASSDLLVNQGQHDWCRSRSSPRHFSNLHLFCTEELHFKDVGCVLKITYIPVMFTRRDCETIAGSGHQWTLCLQHSTCDIPNRSPFHQSRPATCLPERGECTVTLYTCEWDAVHRLLRDWGEDRNKDRDSEKGRDGKTHPPTY